MTTMTVAARGSRRQVLAQVPVPELTGTDLTEEQARELTHQIKAVSARLWLMVYQANERKAWKALGYTSWKAYVERELQYTEARSYQILDTARVMLEMGAAGVDVEAIEPPPARVVAFVKDDLAEVRRAAQEAVAAGTDPVAALRRITRSRPNVPAPMSVPRNPRPTVEPPEGLEIPPRRKVCPACNGHGTVTVPRAKAIEQALQPS